MDELLKGAGNIMEALANLRGELGSQGFETPRRACGIGE